jgi:CRP-like cAMP-binding protein
MATLDLSATHPLVARMRPVLKMSADELAAVSAISYRTLLFSPGEWILKAGDLPTFAQLVLEGFVSTSREVENGKRQIMFFSMPGDMPTLMSHPDLPLDTDIQALSACCLAVFDSRELYELGLRFPCIGRIFWASALVFASIHREWIVNVGHRSAVSRLAHLFCEMATRLEAYGLARRGSCELPFTQVHLSDAIGLSRIHMNRSLQELRRQGLLTFENGRLLIHDWDRLVQVGHFRPDYLCLSLPVWRMGRIQTAPLHSASDAAEERGGAEIAAPDPR